MAMGHEPEKIGENPPNIEIIQSIKNCIKIKLQKYKSIHSDIWCITHLRRGCGQYFAEECIELNIPFTAAIAYEDFETNWSPEDQNHYNELLYQADEIFNVSGGRYTGYKCPVRDRWMMKNSHCSMVIYNPKIKSGETFDGLLYLQKVKKPLIILQPSIQTKIFEVMMEQYNVNT